MGFDRSGTDMQARGRFGTRLALGRKLQYLTFTGRQGLVRVEFAVSCQFSTSINATLGERRTKKTFTASRFAHRPDQNLLLAPFQDVSGGAVCEGGCHEGIVAMHGQ